MIENLMFISKQEFRRNLVLLKINIQFILINFISIEPLSFCLSRGVFFVRNGKAEEEKIEKILFETHCIWKDYTIF